MLLSENDQARVDTVLAVLDEGATAGESEELRAFFTLLAEDLRDVCPAASAARPGAPGLSVPL